MALVKKEEEKKFFFFAENNNYEDILYINIYKYFIFYFSSTNSISTRPVMHLCCRIFGLFIEIHLNTFNSRLEKALHFNIVIIAKMLIVIDIIQIRLHATMRDSQPVMQTLLKAGDLVAVLIE